MVRAEKKQLTRQALLDAALDLMESGRGFCSISLREVTRQTGIVPAAFYRHFPDMDALGLALLDEVSITFREAIRAVRHNEFEAGGAIDGSVRIFLDYVDQNHRLFMFLAREQYGGSHAVRQGIATLVGHFTTDLAADLAVQPKLQHLVQADFDTLADLLVKTVLSTLPELLDQPEPQAPAHQDPKSSHLVDKLRFLIDQPKTPPSDHQDPKSRLIHKLRFIMMGAKHWRGIAPAQDPAK